MQECEQLDNHSQNSAEQRMFPVDFEHLRLAVQEDRTLVLLDFGQCKALTAARQRALACLIIALDKGRPSVVVAAMKVLPLSCGHCDGFLHHLTLLIHSHVLLVCKAGHQKEGLTVYCGPQGKGMEFNGLDGGAVEPILITVVANIIFDVRCVHC